MLNRCRHCHVIVIDGNCCDVCTSVICWMIHNRMSQNSKKKVEEMIQKEYQPEDVEKIMEKLERLFQE